MSESARPTHAGFMSVGKKKIPFIFESDCVTENSLFSRVAAILYLLDRSRVSHATVAAVDASGSSLTKNNPPRLFLFPSFELKWAGHSKNC